jgi:cytochrome c-type biogenesis protein CcmH
MKRALLIALASVGLMAAEPAPPPDRPLPDARQEARAKALFEGVRCVVCQHESIADSPAGVAADMRRLVREEVAAGKTDEQVRADLVRRYGDFVLFKPPVRVGTWLLWFGPFALVLLAGLILLALRRRNSMEFEPLSPDEERALTDILGDGDIRRDADAN